jgi:hypothetical protein
MAKIDKTEDKDQKLEQRIKFLNRTMKNKKLEVVVVINKADKKVVNIYDQRNSKLNDDQVFGTIEQLMNSSNVDRLRSFYQDYDGNLHFTIKDESTQFSLQNLKDEVFNPGLSINSIDAGLSTSFFTERLICANGMITQNNFMTKEVSHIFFIDEYLKGLINRDFERESISAYKDRVNVTYNAQASLNELSKAQRLITQIDTGNLNLRKNNLSKIIDKFGNKDEVLQNSRYLKTPLSKWELINEVTSISSAIETKNLPVTPAGNRKLQKFGGDLLFHRNDLGPKNLTQLY